MKTPLQEKIFPPILSLCIFLVSCGDPDNSSAEKEDVLTLPDEESTSINLEKRAEDSLEKKTCKKSRRGCCRRGF
jgi:hypothetical protein